MALVLTVEETEWRVRVGAAAARLGDRLIPVVKGNGYGLGRSFLAAEVAALGLSEVAVGTVHELHAGSPLVQHVLTPSLDDHLEGLDTGVVLTVGSAAHAAAATHRGPVAVKLRSSMRRYGVGPAELPGLLAQLEHGGRAPHRFVLHLPLAGTDDDRIAEIEQWLGHLPGEVPVSVSHLSIERFEALCERHATRRWQLRLGTALWHGDKAGFHLGAEVLDRVPVEAGATAGYRATVVPAAGHLVLIGAGSAHGVVPLADGRSPFHFARSRLTLLEPPHMHTSMAFVAEGDPCPAVGEVVDVQRPLTQVAPDRTLWIR